MFFSHSIICLVIRCQRILRWPFAIFITYPVMDIFKNLWKRHVFWFLVVFHPCYLLSRNPYTLSVCLVYRIFRNIYSLSIHFCSLCFVLFCFVLLHHCSCMSSSVLSWWLMSYHMNAISVRPIAPNTISAVYTAVVKSVILHHPSLIFDRNSNKTLYSAVRSCIFLNIHFRK